MADNKVYDTKSIISELQKLKNDNTMLKKVIIKNKSSLGPSKANRPKQLGTLQTLQSL